MSVSIHTNKGKLFTCADCDFTSICVREMNKHIRAHVPIQKQSVEVKCEKCDFRTKRIDTLKFHMRYHDGGGVKSSLHKCNECNFIARSKYKLKEHLLKHKDESEVKMFKCDLCDYKSRFNYHLDKHKECHILMECNLCGFKTRKKHNFNKHLTSYICEQCEYQSLCEGDYENHFFDHNIGSVTKTSEGYICNICGYLNSNSIRLKYHLKTHSHEKHSKVYKCEDCLYITLNRSILQEHMLIHKDTSNYSFKCSIEGCTYQTNSQSCMSSHQVTHAKNKGYKCDHCDFQTKWKSSLKGHMQPKEADSFKCLGCNFSAPCAGIYSNHIRNEDFKCYHLNKLYKCIKKNQGTESKN